MSSDIRSIVQETLILLADAGLMYWFYTMYRARCAKADEIEKLEILDLHSLPDTIKTLPKNTLEFGMIEGSVKSAEKPLNSQFTDDYGPVKYFNRTLMKSERLRGYWIDTNSTLSESFDKVPFNLVDHHGGCVNVIDPVSAYFLRESMHTTHDQFDPHDRSLAGHIWDRIVGEMHKGIQSTERLLKDGTKLLGIGKIVYTSKGSLELRKPQLSNSSYILTSMSKDELITTMKSKAFVFKLMTGIFGIAGILIIWVTFGARIRRWYGQYRERRAMEEIREQLTTMREMPESDPNASAPPVGNECVVCLTNSREIAQRPCGHVCMCLNCYGAIPPPKNCPVCRRVINEVIPIFIS